MSEHKIGIIGGSGFIGSALARSLSKSFKVKILDVAPIPKDLEDKVEFRACDVRKYGQVEKALEDVSLVIHAAIIQIPEINEKKRIGYEVNVFGTQNVCDVVDRNPSIKRMLLAGTWHIFGKRGLKGLIDEKFGLRPDEVADRARLYALSKIAQETIVRLYDVMSKKIYGIIRLGTVLGEGMPKKTAANIFITRGLNGEPITPYRHSMYRPMLYVDINDVCKVFYAYIKKALRDEFHTQADSCPNIVNVFWPKPVTILELATLVRDAIMKQSEGRIKPEMKVVDKERPVLFEDGQEKLIKINISTMESLLGGKNLTSPRKCIERIVRRRMGCGSYVAKEDMASN